MLEVISSILDAEKQADLIVKQAEEKSKALLLSSESKAEDIKADAIQSFKTEREEKTRDTEIRAQAEYNKIVNDGNDLAQQLKARVSDKVASAVDFVINNIIK